MVVMQTCVRQVLREFPAVHVARLSAKSDSCDNTEEDKNEKNTANEDVRSECMAI